MTLLHQHLEIAVVVRSYLTGVALSLSIFTVSNTAYFAVWNTAGLAVTISNASEVMNKNTVHMGAIPVHEQNVSRVSWLNTKV